MAEEEFFSLDDDDLEEISQKILEDDSQEELKNGSNKILHFAIIGLLILLILLLGLLVYLYLNKQDKSKEVEVNATSIIKTIKERELTPQETTKAQKLLTQADRLYKEGNKKAALDIYQELSQYNKALSFYNIGVAKLKEKNYKEAVRSFEKAMISSKLRCASAINAATCSLKLEDRDRFDYFLKLAKIYLPYMLNQPLYSYYYTLVNYYDNQPIEALISIKNPTADFYNHTQNSIATKALTAIHNDTLAVYYLVKNGNPKDALTVGLLQARAKEYALASNTLQNAINQNFQPLKANIALALVKNKMGLLQDSGDILKATYDNYKDKAENIYPIDVKLKKSLFDPIYAQEAFKNRIFLDDKYRFSLLFYYAPYQAINSSQTINFITKGAKKVEIDAITPALSYLSDSKAISNVNLEITKGLKELAENRLYEANTIFKEAISLYPAHSTLHYNLALTYAQMFDFQNAYKHFSKSASLDSHNYKALAFKAFCAKLIDKEIPQKALVNLKNKTSNKEAQALITLAMGELGLNLDYLHNNRAFQQTINLIFAYIKDDLNAYKKSAYALKNLLPQDIVSNILYLDSTHDLNDIKRYARDIQYKLTKSSIDLSPLYTGGFLPKELYIQMLNIAGITSFAKKELLAYSKKNKPTISFLQSLAYTYIYTQDFEESYKLYNQLIDEYEQKDSHTLFLASIAALGSNHHANAVALLELAKLTDDSNLESRYALGLLYQEAKNLEGSSIQYKKIGNNNFKSNYFTFDIKKSTK